MYTETPPYSFVSMAYPGDTFAVISFTGQEAISTPFAYEILLASEQKHIDLGDVMESPVTFTFHSQQGSVATHGVLRRFQQLHGSGGYSFYRAELTSKLWWLTMLHHNQIFLDKTIPEVLQEVLQQGGLSSNDFELRLQQQYSKREFICQYRETLFAFVSRWMEFEGIYYFFEHDQDSTKLILTDTRIAHKEMQPVVQGQSGVDYAPPTGLTDAHTTVAVQQFLAERNMVPQKVQIQDYNYETPSLTVKGETSVSNDGKGLDYEYGDGFNTPSEASKLSKVRSEQHLSRQQIFHGEGTVPFKCPGLLFSLKKHFRDDYNTSYLLTRVEHRGNQTGYLVAGLREAVAGQEGQIVYANSFTAIPADVQYRPERTTPWPRISGTLTAKIDASQSGKYAELDDKGRYKVIIPFDLSGRKDGRASCWMRMLQPYAGDNHGMHFPLHKGAEVLLTFVEGNPDRPVIAGAVPNPENPSQVVNESQTMCKITTGGQNKIHMEDKEGSQRILMSTPTVGTWMRLGAPNDPPAVSVAASEDKDDSGWHDPEKDKEGFRWSTEGNWYGAIGQHMSVEVGGNSTKLVIGGEELIVVGHENKTVLLTKSDITVGGVFGFYMAGAVEIKLVKTLLICAGTEYELGEINKVKLRPAEEHITEEMTQINALRNDLVEELNAIGMAFTAINEMNTKITQMNSRIGEVEDSIAESETKLRQDINHVLSEELGVIESSIDMIMNNVKIGDEELMTYFSSTEVTEKVFL
jgi:type VI secretion system secreted protein VgrG